jgi:hypothetical protein
MSKRILDGAESGTSFPRETVCTLVVDAMLDAVEIEICCERTDGVDRVFSTSMDWLWAEKTSELELIDSVVAMMPGIIQKCLAYIGKPVNVRAGLLTKECIEAIIRTVLDEAAAIQRANDESQESEIVTKAKVLRLAPEASKLARGIWAAQCPATNHTLQLQSATNLFYCGYCKVGGGADKLQEFANRRMKRLLSAMNGGT